jgi:hypothetical protein
MSTTIFKIVKVNNFVTFCELYATIEVCVFMHQCDVICQYFLVNEMKCQVLSIDSTLFDPRSTCHTSPKTSLMIAILALLFIQLEMDPESHQPIQTSDTGSFVPN